MNPAIYTEKREKLLEILKSISKYEELDLDTRTTFTRTVDKLQANCFEVVLIGEYQGGKSTTFNAICDGRDISPRGIGIKTSACRVSAQNLPDTTQPEYVEIRWKTDDEIILTVQDIVLRHYPDECPRFTSRDPNTGRFTEVSLDEPQDVKMINDGIAKEWEHYKKRPAAYDREMKGKLDLLYISSLVMYFLNDPHIKKYRATKSKIAVEELANYVAFPRDWATRWSECSPAKFDNSEIMFAFLSSAVCYIHSPNLRRLGCVITDCPGLFAGPWDTMVAEEAMLRADAILYLMRGDKQIGDQDLDALGKIQNRNQRHKLFCAMNARAGYEHLKNVIRPVNASVTNNYMRRIDNASDGTCITEEDICIFHALLAFNVKHYPILEASGDMEEIAKWKKETRRNLINFLDLDAVEDADKIETLLKNTDELLRTARYEELIDKIERRIVAQKAYSLLYANGVVLIDNSLATLAHKLKVEEEAAKKQLKDAEEDLKEAGRILEQFQQDAKQIVETELGDPSVKKILSEDYVKKVYHDRVPYLARNIMNQVEEMFDDTGGTCQYLWNLIQRNMGFSNENSDQFARKIAYYISQALDEECTSAAKGWLVNIGQGQNTAYNGTVPLKLENIVLKIKALWEKSIDDSPENIRTYLDGLLLPTISSRGSTAEIHRSLEAGGFLGLVRVGMITTLMVNISAMIVATLITTTSAIVASIILTNIFGGLATGGISILAAIAALVSGVALGDVIKKHFGSKIRKALNKDLEPMLRKTFESDNVRSELKEGADQIVDGILDAHKKYFVDEFDRQSMDFKINCDNAIANRKKSDDEQKAIAQKARQVRQQIEEFQIPIKSFVAELQPFLNS